MVALGGGGLGIWNTTFYESNFIDMTALKRFVDESMYDGKSTYASTMFKADKVTLDDKNI
jgi:hypothetical protein